MTCKLVHPRRQTLRAAEGRTLSVVKALKNYSNPSNRRERRRWGGRQERDYFNNGACQRKRRDGKQRMKATEIKKRERRWQTTWLALTILPGAVRFCKVQHPLLFFNLPTLIYPSICSVFPWHSSVIALTFKCSMLHPPCHPSIFPNHRSSLSSLFLIPLHCIPSRAVSEHRQTLCGMCEKR